MSKIYCSNCGQLIPKSYNFCRYCGAAQHGEASSRFRAHDPARDTTMAQAQYAEQQARHESRARLKKAIDNCQHEKLCPRAKILFFFRYTAATSIILLLLAGGLLIDPRLFGLALVGYFVVIYLVAEIVYRNFHYGLSKTGLEKEHGILHKKSVSVPYRRIQNININRSVLDRILGMSRISIETAGRSDDEPRQTVGLTETHAEAVLPGLTLKDAEELHDVLLEISHSSEPIF